MQRRAVSTTELFLTIGIIAVTFGTALPLWQELSVPAHGASNTGSSASSLTPIVATGTGTCADRFTLDGGTIRLTASGSVAAYTLGSQLRYGVASVPVTLAASVDGGPWRPIFGGKPLRDRQTAVTQADNRTLVSLPVGATIAWRLQATDGSTYARTATSDSQHLQLLRDGDRLPEGDALARDLGEYALDGRIRIGAHDLVLISHLNDTQASNADWRHASVLLHVSQAPGGCDQLVGGAPRARIDVERLEDRGGRPDRLVRVGPTGTARGEGEWIDLAADGRPTHDAGATSGAGLTLERHGSARTLTVTHAGSGRGATMADLRVTLAGATIQNVTTDSNDTDGAAVVATDRRSVLLYSRPRSGAKAFVIQWQADEESR